jgi:hypothetical protein
MTEQVGRYQCSRCGAKFDDANALSNHLLMHEEAEPETGSHLHAGHDENETRSKGQVDLAYQHADREFMSARVPIVAIFAVFLVFFVAATLLSIPLFAPMFLASVAAVIIAAGYLLKDTMEG